MIYLLYGADELARSEALLEIKAGVTPDFADLNIVTLEGRRLKADALMSACEALPFLAERRVVVVEDALKQLRSADARDAVRDYLQHVPETTDLVFLERDEPDKRTGLYAALKKRATLREFRPREGAELQRWLAARGRVYDATLQPQAGALLAEFVGGDSRALDNELRKLAAYAGAGGTISSDTVRLLVADGAATSVFAFVDALASRKLGRALALLHELLDEGQAAPYLLFMVARQVRLLIQARELIERRVRPEQAVSELKQNPFAVRKAFEQAQRFTLETLLALHDRLVELDHCSKTGRVDPEAALDLLVAQTCA